jgi:putative hemolysin
MDATLGAPYPPAPARLPTQVIEAGSYLVRFARSAEDLDRITRLRFEIFNLELGEGLDAAFHTGRDEDEFDPQCHHLMIVDRRTDAVVGTYRMQTAEMAARAEGFYCATEFDLSAFDPAILAAAVEIGRACVAKAHRNGRVLHLLWRGLAAYLLWNGKHFLFGCCSLTTQDPAVAASVHRYLHQIGAIHPSVSVAVRAECRCNVEPTTQPSEPHIPALFRTYLTLGAKVCGEPAIDRQFKTIDWLVALDVHQIAPATYRTFFR